MSTSTANPEVRSYLEAVRARLADVPESDLEELLDDLEDHLIEVAAEDDGALEDRLGPPGVYAEELRATAGLPTRESVKKPLSRRMLESFERSALGKSIDVIASSKTVRSIRALLPELRPGWWVLRGFLIVWAAGVLSYEGYYTNPFVPNLGSYAVGIAVAAGAIILSVALGRATRSHGRFRRFSLLVNVGIVITSIAAVTNAGNLFQIAYVAEEPYGGEGTLSHADGTPIANICPYAADGTPLSGVLLFDQDGRPIVDVAPAWIDGFPIEPQPAIPNAYPLPLTWQDPGTEQVTPLSCPRILKVPAPTQPETPGG